MKIHAVLGSKGSTGKGLALAFAIALVLLGCGGGGGGGASGFDSKAPTPLALMVDSLGREVPEADFAGGDASMAGVDGSAADGLPLVNAPVTLIDNAGHVVSDTTDAQGYFRLKIKGFTPPFVARVLRSDGSNWFSPSVAAVKVRGFVTVNLTGLTDKLASDMAKSAGLGGSAAQLTPTALASNTVALQLAKNSLRSQLAAQISAAGLNSANFDPVTTPFKAVAGDAYDQLLESVAVTKNAASATVVTPRYALGGSLSGLGAAQGLILSNGSESLKVSANAKSFGFLTRLTSNTAYSVFVSAQPAGLTCSVSNGQGVMGSAPVNDVQVLCSALSFSLGGSVSGLSVSGLVLSNGAKTVSLAAGASSFVFPDPVAFGSSYQVIVQTQPPGLLCTLANGSGTMPAAPLNSVAVACGPTPPGTVSTLAGGTSGYENGSGTVAKFNLPDGVAVDALGNVYVADRGNHAIRKITPTGVVSTVAGTGSSGFVDGAATAARFNSPVGVAVDTAGNIYVGDYGNYAVRKISPAGVVSTLAGGTAGFADGVGTAARFKAPYGMAVDRAGNVVVADLLNHAIRLVSPEGVVSTLAGSGAAGFSDGIGLAASFNLPVDVAIDDSGNVFVSDELNHAIRKIAPSGEVRTLAGNGSPGFADDTGVLARFSTPFGIAVDGNGFVYVADWGNQVIRKISSTGVVNTLAGKNGERAFANGTAAARFNSPNGLALDSAGYVYVVDFGNSAVRKISP